MALSAYAEGASLTFITSAGSIPLPANTAEGDLLVCCAASRSLTPPTIESGWNLIQTASGGSMASLRAWWRVATAGQAAPSVTPGVASVANIGFIFRIRGFDPSSPIDVVGAAGGGTSQATPSSSGIVTTRPNAWIFHLGCLGTTSSTTPTLTHYSIGVVSTTRLTAVYVGASNKIRISLFSTIWPTASDCGTDYLSTNVSSGSNARFLFAIRPEPEPAKGLMLFGVG